MALGQGPQALLTTLYRSTDCLCRRGAAVKNLAQSASPHAGENNAPLKPGTKQLGRPSRASALSHSLQLRSTLRGCNPQARLQRREASSGDFNTARSAAHKTGALATPDLERLVVDTTAQPKAIAHPTDA